MELPNAARLKPGISHAPTCCPLQSTHAHRSCRRSRDTALRQGLTEAGRKVHKMCVETKSKPSDFADLSPVTRPHATGCALRPA